MPAIGQTTPGIEEILVGDAPDGVVLAGEILLTADAQRVLGTRNEAGTHVTARVDTAIGANPGAINQQVTATSGNAQATITHEGATQIRAIAIGGVMGEDSSSASANSFVTFGANQLATSDNAATVQFSNAEESVVEVLSLAEARATLSANASATLDAGIRQSAMADDVALEISNAGTMEFNAEALAEGGTGANATARSERGLWHRVEDQPDATLSIDNAAGGLIASNTAASAATQNGTASATADSRRIIQQEVRGNYFGGEDMGRNAAISLNNAGDIVAIAEADASSVMGNANTNVYQGVSETLCI